MIQSRLQYAIALFAVTVFLLALLFAISHFNTPTSPIETTGNDTPTVALPDADLHLSLAHGQGPEDRQKIDFYLNDAPTTHQDYASHGDSLHYHKSYSPRFLKTKTLSEESICHYGLFTKSDTAVAIFYADVTTFEEAERLSHLILCYRDYFPLAIVGNFTNETATFLCNIVDLKSSFDNNILYINLEAVGFVHDEILSFDLAEPPYRLDLDAPMVAVTYDDGPNENTEVVLEAIAKNRAKATFYVLGAQADLYPNTLKAIFFGHNEVGNHSNLHEIFSSNKPSIIKKTVEDTNQKLRAILGISAATVRPPTGAVTDRNGNPLKIGYPIILWQIDTVDYRENITREKIVSAASEVLTDGAIILMHDIHKTTADAADSVFRAIHEKGFQTVTVSELLEFKATSIENDRIYHSATN